MGKLRTTFIVSDEGEVSYRFWHEDGDGIVWDSGSVDGGKAQIDAVTKAVGRAQAIKAAVAHLPWEKK